MTSRISPARAGNNARALVSCALLLSTVASTLFVPAMAQGDETYCNVCTPSDENGVRVCTMQYCGPVITPEPLPPCCVYGPFGEPYCFGLGRCRMDPFLPGGQESWN